MIRALPTLVLASLLALPALGQGAQETVKSPNFDVVGSDRAKAQEKAAELEEAAKLFRGLFGANPPRGKVVLGAGAGAMGGMVVPGGASRPGEAVWTLPWPEMGDLLGGQQLPQGMQGMSQSGGAGGLDALTHEAAHLMFLHHVNDGCAPALRREFNGYGSYLPDWLDEAVAVYHEPTHMKAMRRDQMKQVVESRIPLEKFFTMDHPIGGHGPGAGGLGGGIDPAELQKKLQGLGAGGVSGEANVFYVQSLSVFEFMLARGGPRFIRRLVEHLQKGGTTVEALAGLSPRGLRTLEGFEAAWLRSIR